MSKKRTKNEDSATVSVAEAIVILDEILAKKEKLRTKTGAEIFVVKERNIIDVFAKYGINYFLELPFE